MSSNYLIKIQTIKELTLLAALLFPICIAIVNLVVPSLGFSLNIYYFFVIFLIGSTLISFSTKTFFVRKNNVIGYIVLIIVLVFSAINFNGLRHAMPIFYLIYLIFLLRITDYSKKIVEPKLKFVAFGYLFFSVLFLFFESSFELKGRFAGFSGSATTYSLFIITIVILVLRSDWKSVVKILTYFVGFYLVFITQTRLNLAFYLLIPIFLIVANFRKVYRILFVVIYIFTLNIVYPVYNLIIEKYPHIVEVRYSDGRDASFGLRAVLFNEVLDKWSNSATLDKWLGNGLEDSRQYIYSLHKIDLFPHNDFVRILNDFGIVATILLFLWLIRITISNKTSFLLGLLYFLSFYHNMIYNLFIISLIILFSQKDKKD